MIMCNKPFINYVPFFTSLALSYYYLCSCLVQIGWIKGLHSHLSPIETGLGETMWDCWMESISPCPRAVSANTRESAPSGSSWILPFLGPSEHQSFFGEAIHGTNGTVHLLSLFLSLSNFIYTVSFWNLPLKCQDSLKLSKLFPENLSSWLVYGTNLNDLARGDVLDVFFFLSPHLIVIYI